MNQLKKPIFCLGIGAQKAGTTWLYNYLDHFSNVRMGPIKEYHVWDAVYQLDEKGAGMSKPDEDWPSGIKNSIAEFFGKPVKTRVQYRFRIKPNRYFDYFESILKGKNTILTGDISPSYSGLPVQAFERIKTTFESRGIEVRVVFLMRDPVNRCWSAVQMFKRNGNTRFFDGGMEANEALSIYGGSAHANIRCDYQKTLENIYKVFSPENVYVGLYENMFEAENVKNLSHFFGLPATQDFVQNKFNVGNSDTGPSPEAALKIQTKYAAVYEYCRREYPETKKLWR